MSVTTEGTLLGKNVEVKTTYDKSILVKVPRSANRDQYGITDQKMTGFDVWRCYEFSTLNAKGVPFYFALEIKYPSKSKYLVESKSLKLYLNSFNMERISSVPSFSITDYVCKLVKSDLSELLECEVTVDPAINSISLAPDFKDLYTIVSINSLSLESYKEDPNLLNESLIESFRDVRWSFNGFRSNCKVTHAPDYATVFLEYKGDKGLDPVSLIKYLTSYRNESHLHEECCELIFHRLFERFQPRHLKVICAYTRRGGIDINPIRVNYQSRTSGVSLFNYDPHAQAPRTMYQ